MFEHEQSFIEGQIRSYCQASGLPDPGEIHWSPIPFNGEWGISTSFFQLASQIARQSKDRAGTPISVPQLAQELASQVAAAIGAPAGYSHVEAVKGYLNLYFSPGIYSSRVVEAVLEQGPGFGSGARKGEQVMVEFSQPNTHKAFHVGHLRSAILGDTLCRILEFAGYDVIRANYPGDIGLHVIKWLWNYMKFHRHEKPARDITRWMGEIYSETIQRLEENPDLEAEVRALYTRWDQRDPEVVGLWEETRQWSLDGFDEMYSLLGIHFDRYYFNSQVEHPGKAVVDELIARGIAEDERPAGPVIVKIDELLGLAKEKYRTLVVLRSDNTALYATEDLALAIKKFEDYPRLSRSFYVVDVRQSLHFQQVFKTLEIAGYPWAPCCQHIPYELVILPGNVVMSSREGNMVLLEDLIREAIARAYQIVEEKNPDLTEEQKQIVAKSIGLGAIRYTLVARDNTKIATFDWKAALDFTGQAAPYVQYAHVRANSILRKLDGPLPGALVPGYPLDPAEVELVDRLSRLPNEVQRAAAELKPLHLTNLAWELAKAWTEFYNACPVLKAEPEVREFRLRLVAAARQALANVLGVIGLDAPEVM